MNTPQVITQVVKNDLCIGCGLCVYKCQSDALKMIWNDNGFLVPEANENCNSGGECIEVCPFNPLPAAEVKTETEIAELFLTEAKNKQEQIGKFTNIYAGFSEEFRLTSSSGGLGTYICQQILNEGIADHIFSVQESSKADVHFEYSVASTADTLLKSSKTRYFPVTLASVFSEINKLEGKIAIVGVGCFIKAIRLAQYHDKELKEKISFLVGIICGGVKSRFFTEYLASKAGVPKQQIQNPEFRKKDIESTAFDYSFSCSDGGKEEKSLKMRSIGDMWGTGMFKANACDFCEDVTTELADISLGDAWLDPFDRDGRGTNVIVTRSAVAEKLIQDGILQRKLNVEPLSLARFLASQQGSFNHRHFGLPTRIKSLKKNNTIIPPKRYANEKVTLDFKWVQLQRMKVRAKSLEVWKNNPDAKFFDEIMINPLEKLRFYTKIYHQRKRLMNRKKRFWEIMRIRFFKK